MGSLTEVWTEETVVEVETPFNVRDVEEEEEEEENYIECIIQAKIIESNREKNLPQRNEFNV